MPLSNLLLKYTSSADLDPFPLLRITLLVDSKPVATIVASRDTFGQGVDLLIKWKASKYTTIPWLLVEDTCSHNTPLLCSRNTTWLSSKRACLEYKQDWSSLFDARQREANDPYWEVDGVVVRDDDVVHEHGSNCIEWWKVLNQRNDTLFRVGCWKRTGKLLVEFTEPIESARDDHEDDYATSYDEIQGLWCVDDYVFFSLAGFYEEVLSPINCLVKSGDHGLKLPVRVKRKKVWTRLQVYDLLSSRLENIENCFYQENNQWIEKPLEVNTEFFYLVPKEEDVLTIPISSTKKLFVCR